MLDKLKAKLEEAETAEAQAIHNLGFQAGRVQMLKDLIAEESEESRPTVERAGKPVEIAVDNTKTEKR